MGENLVESIRAGIKTQRALAEVVVIDDMAIIPGEVTITPYVKSFFKRLGAEYLPKKRAYRFAGLTPGAIYSMIAEYIDWDRVA